MYICYSQGMLFKKKDEMILRIWVCLHGCSTERYCSHKRLCIQAAALKSYIAYLLKMSHQRRAPWHNRLS